jgi:hypothetical protein
LLVLLNDRWYRDDLGGLAEELEGEIVQVALPDTGGVVPEFGPDPILSNLLNPYAGFQITLPPVIGAIGYTFDTDTDAPLFEQLLCAACAGPHGRGRAMVFADLAWHFLKLRYRRKLNSDGLTTGEPAVSACTEPVWVQVLPPANRWQFGADGMYDTFDGKNAKVRRAHGSRQSAHFPSRLAATTLRATSFEKLHRFKTARSLSLSVVITNSSLRTSARSTASRSGASTETTSRLSRPANHSFTSSLVR